MALRTEHLGAWWVPGSDRVRVEFLGGPACGAVLWVLREDLPDNFCRHPDWPEDDYIIFTRMSDRRLTARYAPPPP